MLCFRSQEHSGRRGVPCQNGMSWETGWPCDHEQVAVPRIRYIGQGVGGSHHATADGLVQNTQPLCSADRFASR